MCHFTSGAYYTIFIYILLAESMGVCFESGQHASLEANCHYKIVTRGFDQSTLNKQINTVL